jgi:hypothetical protein
LYEKISPRVPARLDAWISREAMRLSRERGSTVHLPRRSDPAIADLNLSQTDISALSFIILMQAVTDTDNDLEQQMEAAQAQTKAKSQIRAMIEKAEQYEAANAGLPKSSACKPPGCGEYQVSSPNSLVTAIHGPTSSTPAPLISRPITFGQLQVEIQNLQNESDSLNDISSEDQLEIQESMEQKSQFETMMSDLMKTLARTQDTVLKNLKP